MKTKSTKPSKQTEAAIQLKDLAAKKNPKGGNKFEAVQKQLESEDKLGNFEIQRLMS